MASTEASTDNKDEESSKASPALSCTAPSSVTATSIMSMPIAMPLSGLSTIPLALCAMGGSTNINSTGLVQQNSNALGRSGLVLLNVPGTNLGNVAALSQLACGNLGVQSQAAVSMNNIDVQHSAVQQHYTSAPVKPTSVGANSLLQQAQVLNQASSLVGQVTAQAATQGAPSAFLLFPIQLPLPTQAATQPQAQLAVGQTQVLQPAATPLTSGQKVISGNTSAEQQPPPESHQASPNRSPASYAAVEKISEEVQATVTVPPVSTVALPQVTEQQNSIVSTAAQLRPINDPHISSSVQPAIRNSPLLTAAQTTKQGNSNALNQTNKQSKSNQENSSISETNAATSLPTAISGVSTTGSARSSPHENHANSSTSDSTVNTDDITNSVTVSTDVKLQSSMNAAPPNPPSLLPTSIDAIVRAGAFRYFRERKKKGPAPKLDGNEVCSVCGDKASGYHYGVLSCEGCKGFFRRSIIKNAKYQCRNDGQCQMDMYMRRKCQFCRLRKCRLAGMKDETVLSEVGGPSKAKKIKRESSSPFAPSSFRFAPDLSFNGEPVPSLTSQQRNLVELLQANESRYQWPTEEDVAKVTPWVEDGDSHRSRASRFAHFTELAILIVQLVVEFTKQLPGFLNVSREDQVLLLKACTIEVMLLRAAKQYDKKSKAINCLKEKSYDKTSFYRAGMQVEFVDPIFDFCKSMSKLGLDEAEYALLVAINTFSADRPNLKDLKKVETVQDSYVELLRVYLKIHHPSDPLMFPRTLMKLVELRTLNNHHSEQIFALKVQDKQLPPLLAEIWDM